MPDKSIKKGYQDNHVLSPKGCERAYALIGYFQHRHEMLRLFEKRPLKAVFAQDVDSGKDPWGRSERPKQTLQPFVESIKFNLNLNDGTSKCHFDSDEITFDAYPKKSIRDMLDKIKSIEFNDKSVIVSWSHEQMVDIPGMLGVDPSLVPKIWDKKRFDVTWIVERESSGRCTFTQLPQRLLYGDLDTVIDVESLN